VETNTVARLRLRLPYDTRRDYRPTTVETNTVDRAKTFAPRPLRGLGAGVT